MNNVSYDFIGQIRRLIIAPISRKRITSMEQKEPDTC